MAVEVVLAKSQWILTCESAWRIAYMSDGDADDRPGVQKVRRSVFGMI